jgi:hypothetical protein
MALSGVHIPYGYIGGKSGLSNSALLMSALAWSQTMASLGMTTLGLPRSPRIPVNGYGTREPDRQACIIEAKSLATQGLVKLVDTDSVVSDYSVTPSNPTIKSTMDSGDGIHTNDNGQVGMSDLFKPLIAGSL